MSSACRDLLGLRTFPTAGYSRHRQCHCADNRQQTIICKSLCRLLAFLETASEHHGGPGPIYCQLFLGGQIGICFILVSSIFPKHNQCMERHWKVCILFCDTPTGEAYHAIAGRLDARVEGDWTVPRCLLAATARRSLRYARFVSCCWARGRCTDMRVDASWCAAYCSGRSCSDRFDCFE